jgi:hypothetical protein
MDILIIPDSHAKPGVSNERYDWLANLIVDRRPDKILEGGDFADMPSLSKYDRGKYKSHGKSIEADFEAAWDARRRLTEPILKVYKPDLISLGGNHENRIIHYMNEHPELWGSWDQDASGAKEFGWEFIPFLEDCVIEGINFKHYFTAGNSAKEYSGLNAGRNILKDLHESCVWFHTHLWSLFESVTASGKRLFALNAGCYFGHHESYAGDSNKGWWRGITILHDVKDGTAESIERISLQRIKELYQ